LATAGVGVAYQFTLDATANLRQKDDCYGEALAGFAGGAALGVARRSIPFMLGAGVAFGTAMSAFRYTNGLTGYRISDNDDDDVERKEAMRKMRRRPLLETVEQLGEGRGMYFRVPHPAPLLTCSGIYAPGYEERRRERLLARYGIDVNEAREAFQKTNVDHTVSL
jgi:hypothetical protein